MGPPSPEELWTVVAEGGSHVFFSGVATGNMAGQQHKEEGWKGNWLGRRNQQE